MTPSKTTFGPGKLFFVVGDAPTEPWAQDFFDILYNIGDIKYEVVAVNRAGKKLPSWCFKYWHSFHAQQLKQWAFESDRQNKVLISHRIVKGGGTRVLAPSVGGGSSAMSSTLIALEHLGANRVVVCNVLLEKGGYEKYAQAWRSLASQNVSVGRINGNPYVPMERIRGTIGAPARCFGKPDEEFIHGPFG